MGEGRYHDLQFDAEYLTARRSTGGLVRFTHHERALLRRFLQAPRRLLTRAQLLAALDATDEVSERNIDFLVNRLRAKLGDDARHPRYIRTQYGEGYVWVAAPAGAEAANAFIAIGPAGRHAAQSAAGRYLHGLRDTLAAAVAQGRKVVVLETSPMHAAGDGADFLVDAGLYEENGQLRGVLALRHGRTHRMLSIQRVALPAGQACDDALPDTASRLKAAIWQALAQTPPGGSPGPSDEPAYVRMVVAERQLSPGPVELMREGQSQLAARRALLGDDPRSLLERATLRMTQLIFGLGADGAMESPLREAAEAEIESLTMGALPGAQDDPVLLLSAAKLLSALGPAQRELAQALVDAHFENGTALASALVLRAQLRMYQGDIGNALSIFDQCLAHAGADSEFRIYLLFFKAIGLMALARRREVAAIATELYAIRPETRLQLSPLHYATGGEAGVSEALAGHDAARMRQRVAHTWYTTARHFDRQEHRVESMRCIVANAVAAHGEDGVGADVRRQLPELWPR